MKTSLDTNKDSDVRLVATHRIWGFATLMLCLCIPLVGTVAKGGGSSVVVAALIPIFVVVAAAVATAFVWGVFGLRYTSTTSANSLQQLEERIASLETAAAGMGTNTPQWLPSQPSELTHADARRLGDISGS